MCFIVVINWRNPLSPSLYSAVLGFFFINTFFQIGSAFFSILLCIFPREAGKCLSHKRNRWCELQARKKEKKLHFVCVNSVRFLWISSIRHCQHCVETSFQTLLVLSSFYGIFFTFDFFYLHSTSVWLREWLCCVNVCVCVHMEIVPYSYSLHLVQFNSIVCSNHFAIFVRSFASSFLQTRSFAGVVAIVRKYIFFNLLVNSICTVYC